MPVGPYETFGQCVSGIMQKQDVDRETASAICGKMEKQSTKAREAITKFQTAKTDPEIVDPVIWWAVLDDRTCSICEVLHGQVFSRQEAEDHYVAHVNCRCQLLTELTETEIYGGAENWILPVALTSAVADNLSQLYENEQPNEVLPSSTRTKPKAKPLSRAEALERAKRRTGKVIHTDKPIEVIAQKPEDQDRLFIKTFLIDASMSGNAWGVTRESIPDNISSFIGKPLVLYKDAKNELDHPPDGDAKSVAEWSAMQEPFRIGTIVDITRKEQFQRGPHDDQYFAIIEVTEPTAKNILRTTDQTLYVSPGVADFHRHLMVNSAGEPVGELSTHWVGMHLALVREPAYSIKKAGIISQCGGSEEACLTQLRKARKLKENCGFCVRSALLDTSQVAKVGTKDPLRLSSEDPKNNNEIEVRQAQEYEDCVAKKIDGGATREEAAAACARLRGGKQETPSTNIETNPLQTENDRLKQQIGVLETKLGEIGEQKTTLNARIASLEEREISRVLEARIGDENKRKEKVKLYVSKGLKAEDVEDIWRDVPTIQVKKARLVETAGGRATLGTTEEVNNSEQNLRTRKTLALMTGEGGIQ